MVSLFDAIRKPKPTDKDSIPSILQSLLHRSSNGIIKLSPGVAQRILDEANFDGQRDVRPARVQEHLGRLLTGAWIPSFPISFTRLPDGTLVLVNGQHRLNAIVKFDSVVEVRILIDDVSSVDEVRRVYAGHDPASGVRTQSEVLDAIQLGADLQIRQRVRNAAFKALALLNNDFEAPRSTQAEAAMAFSFEVRADQFPAWEKQIKQWDDLYGRADRGHASKLLGVGVTAVGLYTLRHQPVKAFEFWDGVARNDGLKKLDPRHTLISDFHVRAANSGSSRQAVMAPVVAWNAFFENRPLRIIKVLDGAVLRIAGTPFANGPRDK